MGQLQGSFSWSLAAPSSMKVFPSREGQAPEALGWVYALLGKPTPSAFAAAVATSTTPPKGGDFQGAVHAAMPHPQG